MSRAFLFLTHLSLIAAILLGGSFLASGNGIDTEKVKLEVILEGNQKTFANDPSIANLRKIDEYLRLESGKNRFYRENPKDPLVLNFRKFILRVEELIEAHSRLAGCAGRDQKAKAKATEVTDFISAYAARSQVHANPGCNSFYSAALNDVDQAAKELFNAPAQKNVGDFQKILNFTRDERRYSESTLIKSPGQQMYEVERARNPNFGTPLASYVSEKYGFGSTKEDEELRAAILHEKLIQENRKNTVRNYLYYSQHFDFSGETEMLGPGSRSARSGWINKQFVNGGNSANSEYELYEVAETEAKRIRTQYPKPRVSTKDVYRELKPYIDRLAKVRANAARGKAKNLLFPEIAAPAPVKPKKKGAIRGVKIKGQELDRFTEGQQILDEATQGECGFLLQTETFRKADFAVGKTEAEMEVLLKLALKEAIGNTKSYADFLAKNQSSRTNWGTRAKTKEDYAKTSKLLLYSSPAIIGKVLAENPELTGSICSSLKPDDDGIPLWVYLGGGALVLATGGIGAALLGVVAPSVIATTAVSVGFGFTSAASLVVHEKQLTRESQKANAIQGGQAGVNRYVSKNQAEELKESQRKIADLKAAEVSDAIGIATSFIGNGAGIVKTGVRSESRIIKGKTTAETIVKREAETAFVVAGRAPSGPILAKAPVVSAEKILENPKVTSLLNEAGAAERLKVQTEISEMTASQRAALHEFIENGWTNRDLENFFWRDLRDDSDIFRKEFFQRRLEFAAKSNDDAYLIENELEQFRSEVRKQMYSTEKSESAKLTVGEKYRVKAIDAHAVEKDRAKGILTLTPAQAEKYVASVNSKGLLVDATGKPISSIPGTETLYVMLGDGKILVSTYSKQDVFGHAMIAAGRDVACAGEMSIENGVIKLISDKSGHFKPTLEQMYQMTIELRTKGANLSKAAIKFDRQL